MAFTPDGLPAVGFLRPGVILAAGFNGYGGGYTTAAGQRRHGAQRRSTRLDAAGCLLPRRFLSKQPLFLSAKDNLWRIAKAL
jgi:glycine/D-amino acid oxidase-like deaminating enzyme